MPGWFAACLALVFAAGCERDRGRTKPPPPPVPVDAATVDAPSPGPLACADAIPVVERDAAPYVGDKEPGESIDEWMARVEKRLDKLDRMPLDRLLREATPDELGGALIRRILNRGIDHPDQLTPLERKVFAYDMLVGEVNNGGFDQFFFNSSGDLALELRAAVDEIGPPELAPIVACALTAFPNSHPSTDRDARIAQMEAWGPERDGQFDRLDLAFFAIEPRHDAFVISRVGELPSAAAPVR